MAGLAAKFFNGPLAVVPYMGCAGPAEPFTEGELLFLAAFLVREQQHALDSILQPLSVVAAAR